MNDIIDKLVKSLKDAKDELEKNVNCAPGTEQNMAKDAADPKLAPKDAKVKDLQQRIDSGTYRPDSSKIADAMIKPKSSTMSNIKLRKNGQWLDDNMDKAESEKKDLTKVPVRHITSYEAPGQGHTYTLTHHKQDGTTHQEKKMLKDVGARVRNPKKSHTVHLKGYEPIHVDKDTAHQALKDGHFNLDAHLNKK